VNIFLLSALLIVTSGVYLLTAQPAFAACTTRTNPTLVAPGDEVEINLFGALPNTTLEFNLIRTAGGVEVDRITVNTDDNGRASWSTTAPDVTGSYNWNLNDFDNCTEGSRHGFQDFEVTEDGGEAPRDNADYCLDYDYNGDGNLSDAEREEITDREGAREGDSNYESKYDLDENTLIDLNDADIFDWCRDIVESGNFTSPTGSNGFGSTDFPPIIELINDPLPEGRFTSLGGIVSQFAPFILIIGGMVSFLFLIFGGFKYMTAQGDPKALGTARGTITSAIIGLALLASVFVIMTLLEIVFKINILGGLASPTYAQVDIGKEFLFGGKGVGDADRFPDLGTFLGGVVNVVIGLAGVVFFIMLVWGGIRYISARGDEKAVSDARGTLTSAVIGLLIVVSSFAIIKLIAIATGADISIF